MQRTRTTTTKTRNLKKRLKPARPVEGARAKFGSIAGPGELPPPRPDKRMESRRETRTVSSSQADNAPDSRKENSRPSRKEEENRSRPPPEPKNPLKAPQEPPAEMTDPKHGTSYCHICLKEVGGGESGRWQHVRSPAHLSYYLWSQNEEKRFGLANRGINARAKPKPGLTNSGRTQANVPRP